MYLSVKFKSFCKIVNSLITAGNHKSPFDFIWMDLCCKIIEVNALFVKTFLDKPNTKPTYYIKIDWPILKTFKQVVNSLVIIILFA